MARRDWWIGVSVLVVSIALHALVPRYEWREFVTEGGLQMQPPAYARFDRWTGQAVLRPYALLDTP